MRLERTVIPLNARMARPCACGGFSRRRHQRRAPGSLGQSGSCPRHLKKGKAALPAVSGTRAPGCGAVHAHLDALRQSDPAGAHGPCATAVTRAAFSMRSIHRSDSSSVCARKIAMTIPSTHKGTIRHARRFHGRMVAARACERCRVGPVYRVSPGGGETRGPWCVPASKA